MNSTVIKSESDREQFKRDLVKQKIRENFCSIKETFKKYKCRDIEEVLKKGKKEDLSLKERQKLQRFANFFYIEAWKDGKYENLQISKLFCKELEEIMELKVKNIFNSKKLISSLSSFKNRSERGENEMEEEEGFKEIKDSESLSEHLKNVLMPDFIEGIKNKYHLDDIIEIIEGVDVPKSTLPGQPETTKFGSILSKLKVSYN
uniref:Uncharacterized protein n=1 Tax=Strongyloides stercoralis TaxID=6248 RepID=A0AAF5DB17_STRER